MTDPAPARHRLFHAIVVMGGGLALGCGGDARGASSRGGAGGGPGGPDDGGPDAGGGPGGAGSGGADGGGIVLLDAGGFDGSPVPPYPIPCPPSQWDCSSHPPACDYASGYHVPRGCRCNPDLPSSAADCAEGESLACLRGVADEDGRPFAEAFPFQCACVPGQSSCEETCAAAYSSGGEYLMCEVAGEPAPRSVLCGCAVIVLK